MSLLKIIVIYTFEQLKPPQLPFGQSGGAARRHDTKCGSSSNETLPINQLRRTQSVRT
jgi:hypothetical protein